VAAPKLARGARCAVNAVCDPYRLLRPVSVLPDYLAPDLRIVFCGTAAGEASAKRGHYYAGPGNEFWPLLYESGLLSEPLTPQQDSRALDFAFGLTDVAKNIAASSDAGLAPHYDTDGFVAKIETYAPEWVAFHGKEAAKVVSRALGHGRNVALGLQAWMVATSQVFVLPSASGSNRNPNRLEGRASRVDWFRELAAILG
jgi:TDG/mug DNA glycosylase family protein